MLQETIFLKENLCDSQKFLEIGAGGGVWTDFFIKNGASVTCVDISEQVLMGNKKLHPQARFVLADAATVKINEQFDLVFAKDVIEHIQDDMQFLKNMNKHLKNNGLILINTQNNLCLNYLIQRGYHSLRGNKNWYGWDPTHVRFYNSKSLKIKLDFAGFRCVNWFGSYYFPYRILTDHLNVPASLKIFHITELSGLCYKFPVNVLGWNIGVVARKIKSI
jgi:2-polyprenyl-6-hydroxyphenyl methylase/3-demethylubiquinone-9 3-methyltransferase